MDDAEAHNAAGNTAFNAGDFKAATELYFKAVKANGKVAKYRTNLCNALLKCSKAAMAVEEAAAAIAVDSSWPKGYFFKARAFEELGERAKAILTCEQGLSIHGNNAALKAMHSRLTESGKGKESKQQLHHGAALWSGVEARHQTASGTSRQHPVTVTYSATVRDAAGHEQAFSFEHQVDREMVALAVADKAVAARVINQVAMPHYQEMLQAQPWLCVPCQLQHGQRKPATKLFLHTMGYLHQQPPFIKDIGPTPACGSQACATYSTQMAQQLMAQVMGAHGL